MRSFQLGSVDGWAKLDLRQGYLFEAEGPRKLRFELMASAPVEVYLTDGAEEPQDLALVAVGEGLLSVQCTVERTACVQIAGPEGVVVYIRTHDASQLVQHSGGPRYTRLHVAQPPSEYERLMHFARLNALQMEERLAGEIARVRAEMGQHNEVREDEPTPASAGDPPSAGATEAPAGS